MKKYFVLKSYKDNFAGAGIYFTTDSEDDAFLYCDIMNRNDSDGYSYRVGRFCERG